MKSSSRESASFDTALRFVYFDLDDTLLDHRSAEREALRDLAEELLGLHEESPEIAEIQRIYRERNIELWGEYSAGRIDKAELRHRRFEHIAHVYGEGRSWKELDSYYMGHYAQHWAPVDGALGVFERVAQAIPVGIITNGFADTQHAKLDRFPVLRRLSHSVVISEEIGYLKPDGRLFDHAERATGESAENILYVGDSLRSDVRGALAAGWRAAWYSGAALPEDLAGQVFVFDRWADFEDCLAV